MLCLSRFSHPNSARFVVESGCVNSRQLRLYTVLPAMSSCTLHIELCVGRVSSISTLHVDTDQLNPRPHPNPNPKPKPHPLGGSRSAGAITRPRRLFGWQFPPKKKTGPATERRALTSKTRVLHKVLCRMQLHIGRVIHNKVALEVTRHLRTTPRLVPRSRQLRRIPVAVCGSGHTSRQINE